MPFWHPAFPKDRKLYIGEFILTMILLLVCGGLIILSIR